MVESLKECKTLSQLDQLLSQVDHTELGRSGGRKIVTGKGQSQQNEYSLKQVTKKFLFLCSKDEYSGENAQLAEKIAAKIETLHKDPNYKSALTSKGKKVKLAFRRALGKVGGPSERSADKLKKLASKNFELHWAKDFKKLIIDARKMHLQRIFNHPEFLPLDKARLADRFSDKLEKIKEVSDTLNQKRTFNYDKMERKWNVFLNIGSGGYFD